MLKEGFENLKKKLLMEIKNLYGQRLVSVIIFGSLARETQRFNSDMDVLIIAEGLPRGRIKRVKEFEVVEEKVGKILKKLREFGIDTCISPVIKNREEAEFGSPLFLDMVDEAKVIFDRDDFFKNRLDKLRKRLDSMGAKRVWKEGFWYWVLKPDYKLGDVIEL